MKEKLLNKVPTMSYFHSTACRRALHMLVPVTCERPRLSWRDANAVWLRASTILCRCKPTLTIARFKLKSMTRLTAKECREEYKASCLSLSVMSSVGQLQPRRRILQIQWILAWTEEGEMTFRHNSTRWAILSSAMHTEDPRTLMRTTTRKDPKECKIKNQMMKTSCEDWVNNSLIKIWIHDELSDKKSDSCFYLKLKMN